MRIFNWKKKEPPSLLMGCFFVDAAVKVKRRKIFSVYFTESAKFGRVKSSPTVFVLNATENAKVEVWTFETDYCYLVLLACTDWSQPCNKQDSQLRVC